MSAKNMGETARNLYQKLAAVSAEVGPVRSTGKTAQGQTTMSIVDVEDALRERLAHHGLVTGYSWNSLPTIVGQEGKLTVWQADLTVWIRNADQPSEVVESRVCDIGSSPSAAVSFAIKRLFRAIFHLADDQDEARSARVQVQRSGRPAVTPTAVPGEGGRQPSGKGQVPVPPVPPDSQTALRKEAIIKLNRAFIASKLSAKDLTDTSMRLFGKAHRDELTVEELERLAEEVEVAPVAGAKP